MDKKIAWGCALFILVGQVGVAAAKDQAVSETWEAAYLEGAKAGYVHTTVQELKGEQPIFRTRVEFNLTVKRFNDTVSLRMETGTDEKEDGKVTGVFMRYYLAKDRQLVVRGTVENGKLHVQAEGPNAMDKRIPWNDEVVGLRRQERLFKERKVEPGSEFTYLSYEPSIVHVIKTGVTVKDYEEVEIPITKEKRRLLRAEVVPEKIPQAPLPKMTVWLDTDLMPLCSKSDIPGLGLISLYRTTREKALGKGASMPTISGPDIAQIIPIKQRIAAPYDTESAVYRITFQGDEDPATLFAQDGRQSVKNVRGKSFELHVRARREPAAIEEPAPVKDEFLKSSYFITSDDPKVREYALRAVGRETEPWKKAKRIEKWVHDHMENKNFTEAFAPADHVAKTLEGDCTEHAVLAAAMCRAADVPSRAAVGLIYVNTPKGPGMGFHMWAEVYVRGQWLPIDGTLGRGYVGATHLKISDHSWYDTHSLTPLLPAVRVLAGKIGIEVLRTCPRTTP